MGVKTRKRKLKCGKIKKSFQAVVYYQGVDVETKSFDTEGAAWAFHDEMLKQYQLGIAGQKQSKMLFAELVSEYCERELPLKRKSTQQSFEVRLKYFYECPLEQRQVANLGVKDIDEWFNWLHKHPTIKNPKRTSFKHELTFMRIFLNWYKSEYDHRFAVPVVKKHTKRAIIPGVKKTRPDKFVRKEEIPLWLSQLEKHPILVYHDLAFFLLHTGLRMGEACGLSWEDIDCLHKTVSITKSLSWDLSSKAPYITDDVKTDESIRIVPLPVVLLPMLQARMEARSNANEPVFCNRDGNWLRQTKIYDVFTKAFKDAGLQWSGTRITRHTFATMGLVANNGNISAIQATLGHSNRRTTEKYAKAVQHLYASSVDKTADYIGLGLSEKSTK